ncbi:hypothetical protein J6G99_02720 [bacterium]|nr:hypothetical protein [bacterium]
MAVGAPVHVHNTKLGCCPHGLPAGACPICSGMAGGNSTTKRDTPRNVGEMTYNQCAAIGAMLKAQKASQKRAENAEQNRLQAMAEFAKNISNTQTRIAEMTAKIANSMPVIISKPINFVLNSFSKVLNIISNIPTIFGNVFKNIGQKLADISDKLSAIYGEIKSAVEKTVSETLGKLKKKFKSLLFGVEFGEEEQKVEEAKETFNLKTFIHKLSKRLKGQEDAN